MPAQNDKSIFERLGIMPIGGLASSPSQASTPPEQDNSSIFDRLDIKPYSADTAPRSKPENQSIFGKLGITPIGGTASSADDDQQKTAQTKSDDSKNIFEKGWDWLWEPRYNEFMNAIGAPKSAQFTGEWAKDIEQSIGGKTGAAVGGIVSGLENFANSQSSFGALALLIGSLGTSGLFTSAGKAALLTTAGKTVEAGVEGAEAVQAGEAAGAAAKGSELLKKVFTADDVSEIQRGLAAVEKSKLQFGSPIEALADAGVDRKLFYEGLATLQQVGLGPEHLANRGLIVNGGGAMLRAMGMPFQSADKIAKAGQLLLDAGFSLKMIYGAMTDFPVIWQKAMAGDSEGALRAATEAGLNAAFGVMGLHGAAAHGGAAAFDEQLVNFGFKDNPRVTNQRLRQEVQGPLSRKIVEAASNSNNYAEAAHTEHTKDNLQLLMGYVHAEGEENRELLIERNNYLARAANLPEYIREQAAERKTDAVPTQGLDPGEVWIQRSTPVIMKPQEILDEATKIGKGLQNSPEDVQAISEYKRLMEERREIPPVEFYYDKSNKLVDILGARRAQAYLDNKVDGIPAIYHYPSEHTPEMLVDHENRQKNYEKLANEQRLANSANYDPKSLRQLLEAYKGAIDPSPEVLKLSRHIQDEYSKELQRAHQNSVHIEAVKWYITHMWQTLKGKNNEAENAMLSELDHWDSVHTNDFARGMMQMKHRVFGTAFDGQMLGYRLAVTDPIALIGDYKFQLSKLIAEREAMQTVKDKSFRTTDGMPMVTITGRGVVTKGMNDEPGTVWVNPQTTNDMPIEHSTVDIMEKQNDLPRLLKKGDVLKVDETPREPQAVRPENQISELLKKNGGTTHNLQLGSMDQSKMLAVGAFPEFTKVMLKEPSPRDIREKIGEHRSLLDDPRINFGVWKETFDPEKPLPAKLLEQSGLPADTNQKLKKGDSIYRMDLSLLTPDRALAEQLGQQYNQRSITYLDGKSTHFIDTGGSGERLFDAQGREVDKFDQPIVPPQERINTAVWRNQVLAPQDLHDQVTRNLRDASVNRTGPTTLSQVSEPTVPILSIANEYKAIKGAEILHGGVTNVDDFAAQLRQVYGHVPDELVEPLYKKAQDVWTAEIGRALNEMHRRGAKPNYVTDAEWDSLNPSGQVALREFMKSEAPASREVRETAPAGESAKDWYRHYVAGFRVLFPDPQEFEKFTGVLAALLPRKAVREDMIQAINFWSSYKEALFQKPDGQFNIGEIKNLLRSNGIMEGHGNNVLHAINGETLSGPKVEPFRQNLLGNFWKTTLDTWMQLFSNQEPKGFGEVGGKGYAAYLGIQARLHEVSHELGWTPEQVQSSVWVFTKTLAELANSHPGAPFEALVRQMTPDLMKAHSADFIKLIAEDEEVQTALKRIGINEHAIEAAKSAAVQAQTPAETRTPNPRVLTSVAKRLERFRAELEANRKMHDEPPPLVSGKLQVASELESKSKKLWPAGWIMPDGVTQAQVKGGLAGDHYGKGAVRYEQVNKDLLFLAAGELNAKTRELMWHALSGRLPGMAADSLKFQPDVIIQIGDPRSPTTIVKKSKSDAMLALHGGSLTNEDMLGRLTRVVDNHAATADGRLSGKRTPYTLFQTGSTEKYATKYPVVKKDALVDGRVVRNEVPNESSIDSSIDNPTVLRGIREVPLSDFEAPPIRNIKTKALAEAIKQSGEINPLIVVIDKEGPYILEGANRYDAMKILGAKSIPAMVVLDEDSLAEVREEPKQEPAYKVYQESGELTPEATHDLASNGAKFLWDNPSISRTEWDKMMRTYAARHGDVGPELDRLYGESLHHVFDILKKRGKRPQREDFVGHPVEGGYARGIGKGLFQGIQALANYDTNPIVALTRRLADHEEMAPRETQDLVAKSLSDAGYTGYTQGQGPVTLFGDVPVGGAVEPTHAMFEQQLYNFLGGDSNPLAKEQTAAALASMAGSAKIEGISLDDFIDKYFHSAVRGDEPVLANALHQTQAGMQNWYFSALQKAAEAKLSNAGSGKQFLRTLQNTPGVKQAELEWTGLGDYLKEHPKVTKAEVLGFLRDNQIQIQEVTHGWDLQRDVSRSQMARIDELQKQLDVLEDKARNKLIGSMEYQTAAAPIEHEIKNLLTANAELHDIIQPKFEKWIEAGPHERYREFLFTLPGKAEFQSGHWTEPNVLAHVRVTERIDSSGKRTLFVEEVQSDWHQGGKHRGYRGSEAAIEALARRQQEAYPSARAVLDRYDNFGFDSRREALGAIRDHPDWAERWDITKPEEVKAINDWREATLASGEAQRAYTDGVPAAPFAGDWHELVMKRILRLAAEEGYDKVAWTTGEQQAARYNLSQQVREISYTKGGLLIAQDNAGRTIFNRAVPPEKVSDYIGKGSAEKLMSEENNKRRALGQATSITGMDLRLGGQWAKNLYDKMVPEFLNRYTKKWGARVGETEIQDTTPPKSRYEVIGPDGLWDAFTTHEIAQHYVDTFNQEQDDDPTSIGSYHVKDAYTESTKKVHAIDVTPEMKRAVMDTGQALFQKGEGAVQGMTEFLKDGRAILTAFKSADFSTLVHELAHVYRRRLSGDDLAAVEKWAGVKDGVWEVKHEEKWARATERFAWDGEAPTPKLGSIFSRFKDWMHDVYGHLVGNLPKDAQDVVPDHIRKIMAKLYGEDEYNTPAPNNVTDIEARLQPLVKAGGAKWIGLMQAGEGKENLALFNVPYGQAAGATISLPVSEVTTENVWHAVEDKLEELKHGPNTFYQEGPPEPPASDADQLLGQPRDKVRYVWNSSIYRTVPHPVFHDWNFAAHAQDGTKVMVKGELRVHPEAYDYLTRMLGIDQSSLANNKIIGPILKGSAQAKQTLLAFSPFHISQMGLRALMSGVIPKVIKWDIAHDAQLATLVENGMTLPNKFDVHESRYEEGVIAGSKSMLISKIPLLRDYQNWLQKFTFERLMPSLKVMVGKALDDRYTKLMENPQYYEKFLTEHPDFHGLNPDKAAARAAALETNERLGGLNYKDMGRAAGTQDFLRLVALAPDWLESEIRLTKRLLDPTGGKLLRRDMVYFTAAMWGTARMLNMLISGKPHHEAPFGVVVKKDDGREQVISIRTLPTDMLHMAVNPADFLRGRQSPAVRSATEWATGRDAFGRQLTPWQQFMDLGRNMLPIPVQSVAKAATGELSPDFTNTEQAAKAGGLTVTPNRSQALDESIKLASGHTPTGPVDPSQMRAHQLMGEYEDQLRTGKIEPQDVRQMVEDGTVAPAEAKRIMQVYQETRSMQPDIADLYTRSSRLGMPYFLKVWELMNNQEKAALAGVLTKKKNDYENRIFKSMTPAQIKADPTHNFILQTFPNESPWWEK